ncbi:histidinol-phosphate transaminase [Flavobacterium azooxidireducens]|uniref:Histidinol-phosphate aminotransferase n=1 Tax=Flavobacterium azooxidireducens TaxID=1871076 RepID=A0ABY4KEJ5_9FLAO|nr:histidinol-phosphate transaminase [Flavobacterium azooxidireducens]UPQ78974.1 histidinol-phosphate transaminase [Flavobacterium azooxidireducens]
MIKNIEINSSFSVQNLVRKTILNMKPYSSARDEFKEFETNLIFLDANENPFSNGYNRYPDPQQKLLKTLLAKQKKVSLNQILLGNGSDEVLDLLFRAFCEPNNDNIITLPPTYGMYGVLADLNAIENREILLTNDFEPNVDEILNAVSQNTKIIFLCSPNNPTGNSFSDESILYLLKNFNGLVVLDEAYIDFSSKESWLTELNDFPNLVIIQTLSKAYGLAGLRVGIAYASEEIISILNKIKPPYNLNTASQEIALKKLNQNTLNAQLKKLISERESIINSLKSITFIEEVFPSDANFILIKVDNATLRYNQLIQAGIVVRNRSNQPLCENCLRITIGTKEENNQLITTLKSL